MDYRTKRFQLVELVIPAAVAGNNQQVSFQQQPQLQSQYNDKRVYVKAIETYTNESVPFSPFTSGTPVATPAQLLNAVLTLSIRGTDAVKYFPLAALAVVFNTPGSPAVYDKLRLKNQWRIEWVKSYVQMTVAPVGTPYSYLFGVYYDYYPDLADLDDPGDPSTREYYQSVMQKNFDEV